MCAMGMGVGRRAASPTAAGTCDPASIITFSETRTDGVCPDSYTLTRTWTATDSCGISASQAQTITVQDTTSPAIACNGPDAIAPPDAPISFTATPTDNCDSEVLVEITAFDCFFFNPSGRRVDKTESCVVQVDGHTITVLDSGGVGDFITWTVRATDSCGNVAETECVVEVVNPGRAGGKGRGRGGREP